MVVTTSAQADNCAAGQILAAGIDGVFHCATPVVNVEQMIGGYTYAGKRVLLSELNSTATFDDVFEVMAVPATLLQQLPAPFDTASHLGAGLRCRQENGWYVASCGYVAVGSEHNFGPIDNGCVAGHAGSQELALLPGGGVITACERSAVSFAFAEGMGGGPVCPQIVPSCPAGERPVQSVGANGCPVTTCVPQGGIQPM